jgi:hypothetical protein
MDEKEFSERCAAVETALSKMKDSLLADASRQDSAGQDGPPPASPGVGLENNNKKQ